MSPVKAAAHPATSTVTLPPGAVETPDLMMVRTLSHLERKLDTLTQDFREHLLEDARVAKERRQRDQILQKLSDGQQLILTQLSEVQQTQRTQGEELARNTAITSTIADAGRAIGTLRKWFLWVAPVAVLSLGIMVGIWQYRAAASGISP